MVRLHMVNDQIIKMASVKGLLHIFKKYFRNCRVHRIEQHCLLIMKQVGIVGYAARNGINALKHGKAPVVGSHPVQIIGHFSEAVHI